MLDNTGNRQLAYVVTIDAIQPIEGSDNCECAVVGGWHIMTRKEEFRVGDPAIYFEIDSYLDPSNPAFAFMKPKKYKVKTQKYTFGGKGNFISQGLLMSTENFGWSKYNTEEGRQGICKPDGTIFFADDESRFLTKELNITYYVAEDNKRKAPSIDKYKKMAQRNGKLFSHQPFRWLMRRTWGKKLLFFFFGRKKDKIKTHFPTHFPYIKKTDQERCENMPWVLENKTPFVVTEKCDGSSATYILEKKKRLFKNKYEFYVCSRNVRQLTPDQKSFYDENYYWECAIKYDIERKLKDYLIKHPELDYVCWQGEICAPKIQKNPHALLLTHLFLFHMIDSNKGKYDIREAYQIWKHYGMEIVPIIDENYILPDDFEEFKKTADGYYNVSVCGKDKTHQKREGLVYYCTTDPNLHFKNVSRDYLLSH